MHRESSAMNPLRTVVNRWLPAPRARWMILVLAGAILLGGTMVTGVLYRYYQRIQRFPEVARGLPAEVEAARREGIPLTPADLRRGPPIPESQNAAPLYRQAMRKWQAIPESQRGREREIAEAFLTSAAAAERRSRAAELVQRRVDLLHASLQAAARPHCDFQWQWEEGLDLKFTEYSFLRDVVRLLCDRALIRSEAGDWRGAYEDLEACGRIARHSGESQTLSGSLVQAAICFMAHRTFLHVTLRHAFRPGSLEVARRAHAALPVIADIYQMFHAEPALVMQGLESLRTREEAEWLPYTLLERAGNSGLRSHMLDGWKARNLSFWRDIYRALRLTKGDLRAATLRVDGVVDEFMKHEGQPTYELATILPPTYARSVRVPLKLAGERAVRDTLLRVLAYWRERGSCPDSLAALGAPTPMDPCSNQPLLYRRKPDGFTLWSVGENMKDDGGMSRAPNGKGPAPDIVVEWPFLR